jgi:regulator of protease activity HflC (stomatin/prohibitin superfamily)
VDFRTAAIKLAQTNLRNIVGNMQLDEVLVSRETINAQLRQVLDDATDRWGVRVTRVELQAVEPPRDIVEAMSRQMKAERDKRAAILDAEGVRQAQILEAEGERQARILRAEGEAEAIRQIADADKFRQYTVAEGEALAIKTVFGAIHEGDPTHDLLAVKYLEMLGRVAEGQATKIFLPLEASGILSGIAAAGEVFAEGRSGPAESQPPGPSPSPPPA